MKNNCSTNAIATTDINPQLIKTYAYNLDKSSWKKGKFPKRVVVSYEFEFIIHSDGYMNLEGVRYQLKPGDLCLRRPGELTKGEMPYSCYMISFSLSSDKNNGAYFNEVINMLPPVLTTKNPKYYEIIFEKILEQYIKNDPSSPLLIRSLILDLIYTSYQEVGRHYLPSSAYGSILRKAINYIEANYTRKTSLLDIAQSVNLSPSHFQKIFKNTMNISPNDYLTNYRLTKAKEYLLVSNDSITDIAYSIGFESNAYFSFAFKKALKVPPTVYRKSHQRP